MRRRIIVLNTDALKKRQRVVGKGRRAREGSIAGLVFAPKEGVSNLFRGYTYTAAASAGDASLCGGRGNYSEFRRARSKVAIDKARAAQHRPAARHERLPSWRRKAADGGCCKFGRAARRVRKILQKGTSGG